ncbi:MAG: single-stranded-DNA-specific exonuclease RecJ [Lachnospiraceae bacterium]|nr:single-stranded-DNA-specific exonuclease RecJ [Lachnospiraceae bacterium]
MSKWFLSAKKADFNRIAEEFHIDPVIARIIRNRDVISDEEIRLFLQGDRNNLHDPRELKDAQKAAEILKVKIAQGKKIRIIGDYDVDGVCSTYILYRGLSVCGADVDCVIPHRMKDGYGINEELVKQAIADGVDTIITCDNGIAAQDVLENGKKEGLTCIVTDHHEIQFDEIEGKRCYRIPDVDAVVDPKQEECKYPFESICGAVVAYKVIQVLLDEVLTDKELMKTALDELLEPAGIATVCDIMPLLDENRIIVKEAMKSLQNPKNPGLHALIKVNELDAAKLTSFSIGFVIGPCLNATGRLDSAELSLGLLMAKSFEEAVPLATTLKEYNANRKELTEKGVEKALALLEEGEYDKDRVLVLYLPDVHESLAGIIAGRIREKTGKPTFVLTKGEEGVKGSARSIENYHIYDEMTKCKQFFTKYGGHKMAAGLSMEEENVKLFRQVINENCVLTEDDFEEKITIDVPMPFSYVTQQFVDELSVLEPFGAANEKPVFAQKNIRFIRGYIMGKNNNMARFDVADDTGMRFGVVCFRNLDKLKEYLVKKEGSEKAEKLFTTGLHPQDAVLLDVIYYPNINEFRGRKTVQYILQDYK